MIFEVMLQLELLSKTGFGNHVEKRVRRCYLITQQNFTVSLKIFLVYISKHISIHFLLIFMFNFSRISVYLMCINI